MSHKVIAAVVGGWMLTGAGVCWAYPLEDVRVEWWTGSGAHQALLIVDVWPGNGQADSFAFGYRFDADEITGTQLLHAAQDAGRGFSYAIDEYGFLNDIWYVKGGVTYHGTYNWPDSYWSYWVSTDYGGTWEYAQTGADLRLLHDGDTDGWLALPGDDYSSEPVAPLVPTLPGDLNCDGSVSLRDINPFVVALTDPAAFAGVLPGCPILNGDLNGDGTLSFRDINPFVVLLSVGR